MKTRARDSWNCGWDMEQPLPWQVHSCSCQLLLLPHALLFIAVQWQVLMLPTSFGFRFNHDILSSLYVVPISRGLQAICFPHCSILQNPSQDFILITFVLLPSNDTRDSQLFCASNSASKETAWLFNAYHMFIPCRE